MSDRQALKLKLAQWKANYLDDAGRDGGDGEGWREYLLRRSAEDPLWFEARATELLLEVGDKVWGLQPREDGPDLFAVSGVKMPESITRPDGKGGFQQVALKYATISDGFQQANIKIEKGEQSLAKGYKFWAAMADAQRRSGGRTDVLLSEIADC